MFVEVVFVQPPSKLDRNILSLLECPVCTETMTSVIYQCKTGHSFCDICTKKLSCCVICKQEMTNTFNYGLMSLSSQVHHPCKNKETGCLFEGPIAQLRKHEASCLRYECPLKASKGCTFNGTKDDLVEHCVRFHEHLQKESYKVKWGLKAKNSMITKVICAYGNVFKSCRRFTGNELHWAVQFCGREEEAKEYSYSIEFENDRKRLTFSDVCCAVTSEAHAFDDCLEIPFYQLKAFIVNDCCQNNIFIKENKST